MKHRFDAVVIGGGISAYSVALYLMDAGRSVMLVNKTGGTGASGLPGGLANPAYGREAKMSWHAGECLETLSELAVKTITNHPHPSIVRTGVLRPVSDKIQALNFQKSINRYNWPAGSVEWLEPGEAKRRFPLVRAESGALWVPNAYSIDVMRLVSDLREYIEPAGVEIINTRDIRVLDGGTTHTVCFAESQVQTSVVVFAPGPGITVYKQWAHLGFHQVKGQVVKAELSEPVSPGCSISASGYAAFTSPGSVVIGSTYEHDFNDLQPSIESEKLLRGRFARICPVIADRICKTENWAGVRLNTPDRRPYAGSHWNIGGFYCLAGMGSRGLLTAPYAARLLAAHITEQKKLPSEIDISRFYHSRKFRNSSQSGTDS